jgi:hypothetical protein
VPAALNEFVRPRGSLRTFALVRRLTLVLASSGVPLAVDNCRKSFIYIKIFQLSVRHGIGHNVLLISVEFDTTTSLWQLVRRDLLRSLTIFLYARVSAVPSLSVAGGLGAAARACFWFWQAGPAFACVLRVCCVCDLCDGDNPLRPLDCVDVS